VSILTTDNATHTFTWDAENRLASVIGTSYVYDAFGRRVKGASNEVLYDLDGHPVIWLDATNGNWAYGEIYAGNRHVATYSGATSNFLHTDWLGTKRVATSPTGVPSSTCTNLVFGDASNCTGINPNYENFTDDPHDSESNTEHTLFRQRSTAQGRWLSPDPAGLAVADPTNPQSWNEYAYVKNSPSNRVDKTGLCDVVIGGITQEPGTEDTAEQANFANFTAAIQAYPYAGTNVFSGATAVLGQGNAPNDATAVALAALRAAAKNPGLVNVTTFSGGAQALISALAADPSLRDRIGNITYISPGVADNTSLATSSLGTTTALMGHGFVDSVATMYSGASLFNMGGQYGDSRCDHSANCAIAKNFQLLVDRSGSHCPENTPRVFLNGGGAPRGGDFHLARDFGTVLVFYDLLDNWTRGRYPIPDGIVTVEVGPVTIHTGP
jgi:RHS repeat-associated protein